MSEPTNLNAHRGVRLTRPVRIAVAGAGARGGGYAEIAASLASGRAEIVAVAERRAHHRAEFARAHGLPPDAVFTSWQDLLAAGRAADAVIIATQDADHVAAATAFADLGYDILLEKPMATSVEDCQRIVAATDRAGVILAVCHVLRYTPYTTALKALLDNGRIGELVSVEHREPVGFWHFAHSFVRGNWRNTKESTFLLLSKSCHDLDWLAYLVGQPAARVSSFGSLRHFRPEARPANAADRCVDCAIESDCPYSAPKLYRAGLADHAAGAPTNKTYFTRIVAPDMTEATLDEALRTGPYGRCVYDCDNDVVDHQVVNLEYPGGVTASFTLTAFSPVEGRRTTLFGTRGQITGDGRWLTVFDFNTETSEVIDTLPPAAPNERDVHDGGDTGLITAFVDALWSGDPELIRSGGAQSLASHRVVFGAEQARLTNQVVEL